MIYRFIGELHHHLLIYATKKLLENKEINH